MDNKEFAFIFLFSQEMESLKKRSAFGRLECLNSTNLKSYYTTQLQNGQNVTNYRIAKAKEPQLTPALLLEWADRPNR